MRDENVRPGPKLLMSSRVIGRRKTATMEMSFNDSMLQAWDRTAELVKDMSESFNSVREIYPRLLKNRLEFTAAGRR
jgi:hypothetical protein